ncbi:MAG: hypothetical protein L0216_11840 [Planctomycetales bacterium]|nr:hypothetical protein [Planctomycetales bacterium]
MTTTTRIVRGVLVAAFAAAFVMGGVACGGGDKKPADAKTGDAKKPTEEKK